MIFTTSYRNTVWYGGKEGPQEAMLANADEKGHTALIVRTDQGFRSYGSYENWENAVQNLNPLGNATYHYFELIPDGKPCKPYFDFDYEYGTDGRKFATEIDISAFIKKVETALIPILRGLTNVEDEHLIQQSFVWSDSCSDKKLSLHLIIHLEVANEIWATKTGMKAGYLNSLLLSDTKVGKELEGYADSKVYTKNRVMRMIGSSKFGKTEKLRLMGNHTNTRQNLFKSLITYLPNKEIRLMRVPEDYTPLKGDVSRKGKAEKHAPDQNDDAHYDGISLFRKRISPSKVPFVSRIESKVKVYDSLADKWGPLLELIGQPDKKKKKAVDVDSNEDE